MTKGSPGCATSVEEIQVVGQHVALEAHKDPNQASIVHNSNTNPVALVINDTLMTLMTCYGGRG